MHFQSIYWSPGEGFEIGSFTLRFYSLMFVVAFTLGWFLMKKIYEREGLSLEKLDKIFIYTVIATLIGARLGHFLFYEPEEFIRNPLGIILPVEFNPFRVVGFRGLASHGAAIGIFAAMYLYSKKVIQKPIFWILDRVVIPISGGAIFVRLGNFFNSEIIGKPVDESYPLGVVFKNLGESFPRHPAQLYEAFGYVFVFAILYYLYWKTDARNKSGLLFGAFLVLLWSVRFLVEFVKESQGGFESALGVFSTGQWLSIPFVIIGLFLVFRTRKTAQ
jgi:prolipoprotein diacylglyceryl transferase